MKNGKNFITTFFVTLFLLFNVASLHALTEHDDDSSVDHCEICHIATAVNFIPLLETEPTLIPDKDFFFTDQQINDKALVVTFNNQYLSSCLFTRPPPTLS
jgi:hypothetical protein